MTKAEEKFDKYLAKIKKSISGLSSENLAPEIPCPFCEEGISKLKIEKFTHASPPYIYEGDFFVYRCDKCKQRFTTSLSDSISILTLKPKRK